MREKTKGTRVASWLKGIGLAVVSAGLGGCGDITVREYNAARWVTPETSFVYIRHVLMAGKLSDGGWSAFTPDSALRRALLDTLSLSREASQYDGSLWIDNDYERLCAGGFCMEPSTL